MSKHVPICTFLNVKGYFNPEEWTNADGKAHNRVSFIATKFYSAPDKKQRAGHSQCLLLHFLRLCPIFHPGFILIPHFFPIFALYCMPELSPALPSIVSRPRIAIQPTVNPKQLNNKTLK